MADTKLSALSEISVPALTDYGYTIDGGPTSDKISNARLGGLLNRGVFQARLTTETGVAVSTSNRTAQGTIYLTPMDAGLVRKWDGTRWTLQILTEISLALTVTSGKAYDVFYNGTALSLSNAWTNDTTPADALGTQDNIKCLGSDHTKLYVGSLYASGSNIIEDSLTKRYLYNEFNQVPRQINKSDSTSHPYAVATAQSWNADATNQADFMLGTAQDIEYSLYGDITPNAAGDPAVYAIPDWTSGSGTVDDAVFGTLPGASNRILNGNTSAFRFTRGRHYIRAVEIEFGAVSSTFTQFGIRGLVWM